MALARSLTSRTEKGKAYRAVSAETLAVLGALLWPFHNAKSGLCFPSDEAIAEAAGCARSTVAEALKALEEAGVLTWVHRIRRIREGGRDLFRRPTDWRVLRTSNGYRFRDRKGRGPDGRAQRPESGGFSTKSDLRTQTWNRP